MSIKSITRFKFKPYQYFPFSLRDIDLCFAPLTSTKRLLRIYLEVNLLICHLLGSGSRSTRRAPRIPSGNLKKKKILTTFFFEVTLEYNFELKNSSSKQWPKRCSIHVYQIGIVYLCYPFPFQHCKIFLGPMTSFSFITKNHEMNQNRCHY